jgi:hypothetical protein
VQFSARLKGAQDVTARDDPCETAIVDYRQLIHVLAPHRFKGIRNKRI